jgi:hypothetical protein
MIGEQAQHSGCRLWHSPGSEPSALAASSDLPLGLLSLRAHCWPCKSLAHMLLSHAAIAAAHQRAKNRGYTSLVYTACGTIFIRAFQQDIICGIYLFTSKVIVYSFKGIIMNE